MPLTVLTYTTSCCYSPALTHVSPLRLLIIQSTLYTPWEGHPHHHHHHACHPLPQSSCPSHPNPHPPPHPPPQPSPSLSPFPWKCPPHAHPTNPPPWTPPAHPPPHPPNTPQSPTP